MRIGTIIILLVLSYQMKAQQGIADVINILNEPLQEQVEYHLDTMFNGQDTIFTETDSFILFTTPDMVIGDIDTVEYRYIKSTVQEWSHNGDELTDLIAVVYLADKRTRKPLDSKENQSLVVATGNENESFDISYLENVIACPSCGLEGAFPDISILTNGNAIELIEVRGSKKMIFNDEYKMTFEDNQFIVNQHVSAKYDNASGNLLTSTKDRTIMMRTMEFEPEEGEKIGFKAAIMPAELTRPIKMDGKLDEKAWNQEHKLNWRPVHSTTFGEKHTMNDLFARYSAAWNNSNLYIAINIKDDVLVPADFSGKTSKGDYIQLDFNLNPKKMKDGKLIKTFPRNHVSLGIGFDKYGKPIIRNLISREAQNGVEVVFGRKDDGYTVEIGIPIKNLKEGKTIPFTVSVGDADNREDTTVQNIDASSSMDERIPFKLGEIELFRAYHPKTFRDIKKN